MRVILGGRRVDTRDERGVVAIIVAICAVMIFGFAAYAIDSGNLWATRRHTVTASDAGALGAAGVYARGDNGCGAAPGYVTKNDANGEFDGCDVNAGEKSGYVTVGARQTANFTFAGIFGLSNKVVHSKTTAEWGLPSGVSGLRPFGLCIEANADLKAWLNLPTGPTGDSQVIRITYGKEQPDACGSNVPGNWGVQDFDGGANSNNDTKDWTLNGYDGEVTIGQMVDGDTGAFSQSLGSALDTLVASGEPFALPIFDSAAGNGSNAEFHIVAFAFVKLIGYKANGVEAQRYFDLQFLKGQVSGSCCNPNGIDTGVRVVHICDIDTTSPTKCQTPQ